MATATRIYQVTHKASKTVRLVRATHPSRALHHVAADEYSVEVASQEDLITLLEDGVKVEDVKAEPAEPSAT
jgi:hypothetical protein